MRIDSKGDFIASVDDTGMIIIWSLKAALQGQEGKLTQFQRPDPEFGSDLIELGSNFVVSHHQWVRDVVVFDFP